MTDEEKLARGVALLPWCRNAVAHEGIYPVKIESDEFRIIIAALEAGERIAKPAIAGGVRREAMEADIARIAKISFEAWCTIRNYDPDDPKHKVQHDLILKDIRGIFSTLDFAGYRVVPDADEMAAIAAIKPEKE